MPVVVVAGAGAAAAGGAAGGAAAGASAASASGGAAAGAAGSAGASSGTAGGAAASGSASGTGASGVGTSGAGASGGASQSGMKQTLSKADPMMSTQSGSLLGNKVKSNFGANVGDGFKAGANSVDGSISGQNMSLNKSDAKAYDKYKDRVKDVKDNVDRVKNTKDALTSESDDEEDEGNSYIPDAEALKKERKNGGVVAKVISAIAIIVFLVFFLVGGLISAVMAPIGVAKEVGKAVGVNVDFTSLIFGSHVGGVAERAEMFAVAAVLISEMSEDIFRGNGMSKELLQELVYLSESSYDNAYYPFKVKYLSEYKIEQVKVGETIEYGDLIVNEDGDPILDSFGRMQWEILGTKDVFQDTKIPVYGEDMCTLNMGNYNYAYYVPWELMYAIAVASDMYGSGDLNPKELPEDVFEKGLIYEISDALMADVSYYTDYKSVYYQKIRQELHGSGFTGTSNPASISYEELRSKAHRVIEFAEEGYMPEVVIVDVKSCLYHYEFAVEYKDGRHRSTEISRALYPDKLKAVVEEQGLSIGGKKYMIELLLALEREDLALLVDEALEIGYRFSE